MNKKSILLITGFLLFVISIIGFILNLVGVSLSILKPIDDLGFLLSTVIKLIMLVCGIMMVYYVQLVKR